MSIPFKPNVQVVGSKLIAVEDIRAGELMIVRADPELNLEGPDECE